MKKYKYLFLAILLTGFGCDSFLDEKPSKDLVVPQTIAELQGLLDNTNFLMNDSPALIFNGTDDFWTTNQGFQSFNSIPNQNSYVWEEEIFDTPQSSDWLIPYRQVFYANVVLEEAMGMNPGTAAEQKERDELMGRALFMRAKAFFDLAGQFAPVYQEGTAGNTLGIVIRTNPKITDKQGRATLQETYDQILGDLNEAIGLLPETAVVPTRPTRTAGQALMARIYLSRSDYAMANQWAKASLESGAELLDFNEVMPSGNFSFSPFNRETLYYSVMNPQLFHYSNLTFVNEELYGSYDSLDLRKELFYRKPNASALGYVFRGSFSGDYALFSGLSTGELYLILAETEIRLGRTAEGLGYLNELLEKRYKAGEFQPWSGLDESEALNLVLEERRKELAFRGLRWSDLRRLNQEPALAKTLSKTVNGMDYSLAPNSPRYVFPIPLDELQLNGLEPNIR
jgi:hypothetical protein